MALAGRLAFITGIVKPALNDIITIGAGSGIGKATCQILARDGALIVAADKNLTNAEETVNTVLQEFKQKHISLELDVGNSSSIDKALNRILTEYGKPPTIIVNCAGITRDNFLLKLSEQDFDEVLKINLKGTFLIVQKLSKIILDHGINKASIINIASIVGKYGNIGQANYAASKAGVERLTRTASMELANKGIRVNVVLPGFISTPMTAVVPDKVKNKFLSQIPIGRFGEPEEIAEVIAFLASDKSSYITGASIDVTGGF